MPCLNVCTSFVWVFANCCFDTARYELIGKHRCVCISLALPSEIFSLSLQLPDRRNYRFFNNNCDTFYEFSRFINKSKYNNIITYFSLLITLGAPVTPFYSVRGPVSSVRRRVVCVALYRFKITCTCCIFFIRSLVTSQRLMYIYNCLLLTPTIDFHIELHIDF